MSKLSDPTAAAQRWAQQLGAATQAYTDGVNSVTTAPGQLAAASADRWANNTVAAKPRFAANSAAVTKEMWQQAAINKGAPRLGSGATQAQPKMAAVFTKLFPAIQTVRSSLPARGDINANIERSRQFALGMNAKKGSFKA